MFLAFFTLLVSFARYGTVSYDDCRHFNFEMDHCTEAKFMHDTNELLSEL